MGRVLSKVGLEVQEGYHGEPAFHNSIATESLLFSKIHLVYIFQVLST